MLNTAGLNIKMYSLRNIKQLKKVLVHFLSTTFLSSKEKSSHYGHGHMYICILQEGIRKRDSRIFLCPYSGDLSVTSE